MENRLFQNFLKAQSSIPSSSKELITNVREKLFYCHHLLNHQSKLSPEEKMLFDGEELLSAYQHIIANSCGEHRHRRKILPERLSVEPALLPIHRFCRKGVYPGTSIQRQQMNDEQVPWTVDLSESYNPPYHTDSSLLRATKEIDPEEISSNFMWNAFDTNYNVDRRTANPTGHYSIDSKGYPLNPLGRTGLCGRGELKRWAVNYQTHLVIMCGTNEIKSGKEIFKYIMKKSKDSYHHCLPSTWTTGTNLSAITKTLRTYLFNICLSWNDRTEVSKAKIDEIIEHLTFVSTAYIDDSKNTDNAWLETSVCCYIQTNLHPTISSNLQIDLNELFPDPSKSTYAWHQVTRTSELLDSERDVIKLISKRYNAFW